MDYREQDYLEKVERADNYSLFNYGLFKKLTIIYEGIYESRYKIKAQLVPYNTGPFGYINRAKILITDNITNKTATIYTNAFGLEVTDEIKGNLQVLNKDREFEPRFLKSKLSLFLNQKIIMLISLMNLKALTGLEIVSGFTI